MKNIDIWTTIFAPIIVAIFTAIVTTLITIYIKKRKEPLTNLNKWQKKIDDLALGKKKVVLLKFWKIWTKEKKISSELKVNKKRRLREWDSENLKAVALSHIGYLDYLLKNNSIEEIKFMGLEISKIFKNIYKNSKFLRKNSFYSCKIICTSLTKKGNTKVLTRNSNFAPFWMSLVMGEKEYKEMKVQEITKFIALDYQEKIWAFEALIYVNEKDLDLKEKVYLSKDHKNFKAKIKSLLKNNKD